MKKTLSHLTSLVLAATLLAGCAWTRPEAPEASHITAPEAWRVDGKGSAELGANWWNGFGDPVLAEIVSKALANNDDLAMAAERVLEARAQYKAARGQLFPSLVLGAGGVRERYVNAFGQPTMQNAEQAEFSASYDVDLFGRIGDLTEASKAQLLATQAAQESVKLAVVSSAASGYITLRSLDARLAVLEDTLTARADSLKIARRRAETGYASQLELEQAEAEYRATEQLIPATKLAITKQENGLSVLLGETSQAIIRGSALADLHLPSIAPGLPSNLLRRRPDIFQAEQQVVAADASLDAARAAMLPSIRLTADAGYVESSLLADPVRVFDIGGSILAPIFEGGRLRAQADAAAARRDTAAFAYRKAVLGSFRDVNDALSAVQRNTQQNEALVSQRDALARALDHATRRYRSGYSPFLEQLDTQRSLLSAELALVQSQADRLNAAVNLYQALGGGWQADTVTGQAQ